MPGGMRIDGRTLPPAMQEQAAVKIAEQLKAAPVAGAADKNANRVTVQKLRFPSTTAMMRYLALRDVARGGVIFDLIAKRKAGRVFAITYRMKEGCGFIPSVMHKMTDFRILKGESIWNVEEAVK